MEDAPPATRFKYSSSEPLGDLALSNCCLRNALSKLHQLVVCVIFVLQLHR